MKLLRTCLLAVVIIALTASCSKDEGVEEPQVNLSVDINLAKETDWVIANEILSLINDHRATLGLPAIKKDQQYASAYAVEHTKHMIATERVTHENFGVRAQALKDRGAVSVGENLAFGYKTAADVVNAWLHSDSHRNVIEGNYTHSGFGVIANVRGNYYFTHLFYRK